MPHHHHHETSSPSSPQSALQQLLEDLSFLRAKNRRRHPAAGRANDPTAGFVSTAASQGNTHWTDLFVRHFLFQSDIPTATHRSASSATTNINAASDGRCTTPASTLLMSAASSATALDEADDLLFFVRKRPVRHQRHQQQHQEQFTAEVSVCRKDSRKLPIGDPDVDWQETVYLNLIVHQFVYTLTLAICTRTSPHELQVLRRHTQRVYASPSRRQMDGKGEREEWTYPHVCFTVDNFDEVFGDMMARDGEMVCVELVASERPSAGAPADAPTVQSVLFLGSIRYDALRRVYESRQSASLSARMVQRMRFGMFGPRDGGPRCEFVRMNGPRGKGHAEMAVTKPKGSGVETPTSEPGFCATDAMWDDDYETAADCEHHGAAAAASSQADAETTDDDENDLDEAAVYGRRTAQRRRLMSDPSANLNNFTRFSWRSRSSGRSGGGQQRTAAGGARAGGPTTHADGDGAQKARSQSDGLDALGGGGSGGSDVSEILAGDLTDELDDGALNPLWTSSGSAQSFHFWKEHRRQQSTPLSAFCTYVSLPWWYIAGDLLCSKGRPMLTF